MAQSDPGGNIISDPTPPSIPSGANDLSNMISSIRLKLNNVSTDEITDAQMIDCCQHGLDAYSAQKPIRDTYYDDDTFFTTIAATDYVLPAETIAVEAILLRPYKISTLVGINRLILLDNSDTYGKLLGNEWYRWYFKNNVLQIYMVVPRDNWYIMALIHKAHVFDANGNVTTIPQRTLRETIEDGARGKALMAWAGYQGNIHFGTAGESREGIYKRGLDMWESYVKQISTGAI